MIKYHRKKKPYKKKIPRKTMKEKLEHLQHNITTYGGDYNIPTNNRENHNINLRFENLNLHSWFSSDMAYSYCIDGNYPYFDLPNNNKKMILIDGHPTVTDYITFDENDNDGYKTRQIKLNLTNYQKIIIECWFNMYILVYNCANRNIKARLFHKREMPSLSQLKKELCEDKIKIQTLSKIIFNVNNTLKTVIVPSHVLDYAINDLFNAYTACFTKIKNGTIKTFRIRYLKQTKPNKIIKIEKYAVTDSAFYPRFLGKIVKCEIENFNYLEHMNTVATVVNRGGEYFLLMKFKQKIVQTNEHYETVGVDLGLRTFATTYSNSTISQLGIGVSKEIQRQLEVIDKITNINVMTDKKENKIKILKEKLTLKPPSPIEKNKYLKEIERIKNSNIEDDIKAKKIRKIMIKVNRMNITPTKEAKIKKAIKKLEEKKIGKTKIKKIVAKKTKKIQDRVSDMHWKIAHHLTRNYQNILIGNFSTKSMGESDNVRKMQKRIGNMLSVYKFREIVKYKCRKAKAQYKLVDEAYTTQCCGNCGFQKKDVGGDTIYNCDRCRISIPRDFNSARLMVISAIN